MTGPLRAVRVQDSFHHLPLRATRWWRRLRFVRPRNTLGSVALPGSASPLCWSYFQGLIHAQILSCIISASATHTSDQRFLPFGSRTTSPRTYIATSAHETHKHTCLLDHSAARAPPYHPLFPAPCFQLPTHTTQSTSKHRKQQPGLQRHHGFSNAMRYLSRTVKRLRIRLQCSARGPVSASCLPTHHLHPSKTYNMTLGKLTLHCTSTPCKPQLLPSHKSTYQPITPRTPPPPPPRYPASPYLPAVLSIF